MSPFIGGVVGREIMPDGLQLDDKSIPQGIDVGVGIHAIHYNPIYFTRLFNRWLERQIPGETLEEWGKIFKSAFTPLSKRLRNCVGKRLVYLDLTLALVRVIWSFEFERVKDLGVEEGGRPEEERRHKRYLEARGGVIGVISRMGIA